MAEYIAIPKLGMQMTEATLVEWKVSEGGRVEKGDVVLTIETEKTEWEVEAAASGLVHILMPAEEELGNSRPVTFIHQFVLDAVVHIDHQNDAKRDDHGVEPFEFYLFGNQGNYSRIERSPTAEGGRTLIFVYLETMSFQSLLWNQYKSLSSKKFL